jgi:hypothetical protein
VDTVVGLAARMTADFAATAGIGELDPAR